MRCVVCVSLVYNVNANKYDKIRRSDSESVLFIINNKHTATNSERERERERERQKAIGATKRTQQVSQLHLLQLQSRQQRKQRK